MGNYKRTHQWAGRPALLDNIEREYRDTWLQPISEMQVPCKVRIFETRESWTGYRIGDPTKLEVTWLKLLWKEVPSPIPSSSPIATSEETELKKVSDSDDEETLEVDPI